jgi:hypothetical protein
MTRPAFLTRPGVWIRTPRTGQTPTDYACAVQHNVKPRTPWSMADVAIAVLAVATLAGIAAGVM